MKIIGNLVLAALRTFMDTRFEISTSSATPDEMRTALITHFPEATAASLAQYFEAAFNQSFSGVGDGVDPTDLPAMGSLIDEAQHHADQKGTP